MGSVVNLLSCEHYMSFKDENVVNCYAEIRKYMNDSVWLVEKAFCYYCKDRSHCLHICLHCLCVGCFESKHFLKHAVENNHFLGIDSIFGNLFCYVCSDYIYDPLLRPLPNCYVYHQGRDESGSTILHEKKYRGLRGLVNLGNSCYLSCIIQILVHTPLFRFYFLIDKHNITTCKFNCDRSKCAACVILKTIRKFYKGRCVPCVLHKLLYFVCKNCTNLQCYQAEDAQEFFITMLDILHESLKRPVEGDNGNNSPCQCAIHKIYNGTFQSDICCQTCEFMFSKFEDFLYITLDLSCWSGYAVDLYEVVNKNMEPEMLERTCDNCNTAGKSTRQLTIKKLPNTLVFHLNRKTADTMKIKILVSFPERLNMSYFLSEAHESVISEPEQDICNDNQYFLCGVVQHIGEFNLGHYKSYIKNRMRWFCCDDEKISQVSIDDVLSCEAYLLFYQKEIVDVDSLF